MYGINTKNGRTIRGAWQTQSSAGSHACQKSRNEPDDVYYVTDENGQRVAVFQKGSDVSEREGIHREVAEVFRVIDQRGNVHEASLTWRSGEFKMRRRVVTIGKHREEFHEGYAKRACVAWAAGQANIAVAEILAVGEPTRAELIASTGGVR